MADSLRLLSFNTQLRSYAMEAGAAIDLLVEDTAEARARAIANRILASPFDYDIIGLMELFDQDAREILGSRLRTKYPDAFSRLTSTACPSRC